MSPDELVITVDTEEVEVTVEEVEDVHLDLKSTPDVIVLASGHIGPRGPEGDQGPQGVAGPTGPQGTTGPQGVKGDTGAQGPQGNPGATGSQGPQGTAGEKWFVGSGAPPGATGALNDWYIDSANGDFYEKTGASTWTLRGNLKGPQGVKGDTGATGSQGPTGNTGSQGPQGNAGTPGEKWFTGSGAPAGNLAGSIQNDWYLDSANGDYYEKTSSNAWTLRGNLKGPTGSQGPQGPAGTTPSMTSVRVARTTTQAIPKNALTPISFDLERYDNGGCWVVGQPTRLTAPIAGTYDFWGAIQWASDTVGRQRQIIVRLNGTTRIADGGPMAGAITAGVVPATVSGQIQMAAGDYIELCAMHDSTATNLNITYTAWEFNEFGMALAGGPVGPQGPAGPAGSTAPPAGILDGEFAAWDATAGAWVRSTSGELIKVGDLGIQLGVDTNLYRSAADVLKTDDNLWVAGLLGIGDSVSAFKKLSGRVMELTNGLNITSGYGLGIGTPADLLPQGSGITFGTPADTKLYRPSAGKLKTDGIFEVAGTLLLPGDSAEVYKANARLFINGQGNFEWGPGDWTRDTNLYRAGVDILKTDDRLFSAMGFVADAGAIAGFAGIRAAGDAFISNVYLNTDTQSAFRILGSGKLEWGPGGTTPLDVNLYRWGPNYLKTDNNFVAGLFQIEPGTAGDSWAVTTKIQGDTQNRLIIGRSGQISWGSGSASHDVSIYRWAAGYLATDGIVLDRQNNNSKLHFGSAVDVNLYRSAADTLKTDDGLWAVGGIVTKTKAGIPTDADLVAGMQQSGAIMIDTTNSRLYVRVGTTWKYAALT